MFKSYSNLIPKNFLSICNKAKCFTTYIPSKPTWDLVPIKTRSFEENIDIKKLEKLSMLKIDATIEQDLRGVIVIAERMSQFESIRAKEFVDFDELSSCKLRDDNQILTLESTETDEERLSQLFINAKYTYEDYFIAPPSNYQS